MFLYFFLLLLTSCCVPGGLDSPKSSLYLKLYHILIQKPKASLAKDNIHCRNKGDTVDDRQYFLLEY